MNRALVTIDRNGLITARKMTEHAEAAMAAMQPIKGSCSMKEMLKQMAILRMKKSLMNVLK